jgi:5-methylcytosine-specific restriction endonuclease McrA
MQRVLVLDKDKNPLMPCTPARARILLSKKEAAVFKTYPFTIILKNKTQNNTQPIQIKIDQGSKTTGIALVAEFKQGKTVIFAANLQHKGLSVSDKLTSRAASRRSRRSRKTRYRKPKWTNSMSKKQLKHINQRPKGWFPPSVVSRVDNITNLVNKLKRFAPINAISVENIRFDTQLMENANIKGVQYQQGTLFEKEVKEYLLHLFNYKCAYCHGLSKDPILEKEHIIPRSKNGSNRVDNLALACHTCNQAKNNLLPSEWLTLIKKSTSKINEERVKRFSKIIKGVRPSLRDAAVMNAIRYKLVEELSIFNLPIELGSGGLTKFNRTNQHLPKDHWIDAACIGKSGDNIIVSKNIIPLNIKAIGRGSRQMCRVDGFGFPRTKAKKKGNCFGFKTGDIVKVIVTKGKKQGTYVGRLAVRETGYFNIVTKDGFIQGINHRYCRLLQKNDGYNYSNHTNILTKKGEGQDNSSPT